MAASTAKKAKSSGRGSKPGERRGGRQKGTPNKATAALRDICRQYTENAVHELARLAMEAESEASRVAAIKEILDRGYGKAPQPMTGEDGEGPMQLVVVSGVPRAENRAKHNR